MKTIRFVFLMALALSLVGCAVLTSPAKQDRLNLEVGDNAYWFAYDASRRGAILIADDPNSQNHRRIRMCAEPTPDIAFNVISKIDNILNYKGVEGKVSGELTTSVIKLAETTQMVMFLRESMFRLCEISINTGISQKEVETLYREILDIALHLGTTKAFDRDFKKQEIELALITKDIEVAEAKQKEAEARIKKAEADIAKAQSEESVKKAEADKAKAEADRLKADTERKTGEADKIRLQAELLKTAQETAKKAEVVNEQAKDVANKLNKDLKQQELFK